jgi:chromosome segregation ATPase
VRVFEQSAEDSQRSAEMARRALVSVEGQLLALRTEHSKELEDITICNASERAHLLEIADRTNDKLRDREEALRKAMRDISDLQNRAEASEGSLRRAHAASSSAMKKKLGGLETEATSSAQKADSARLKREKEILHDKVRELEHQVDTERRKNTGLRRDLVARKESASAEMSEEKARLNMAEEELSPLKTKLVEITAKCSMLEGKYREASAANAALQVDAKSKLTTLQTAFKERLDFLKSKLKVNVIKERKRGDAYKEKALEAHSRNKSQ